MAAGVFEVIAEEGFADLIAEVALQAGAADVQRGPAMEDGRRDVRALAGRGIKQKMLDRLQAELAAPIAVQAG